MNSSFWSGVYSRPEMIKSRVYFVVQGGSKMFIFLIAVFLGIIILFVYFIVISKETGVRVFIAIYIGLLAWFLAFMGLVLGAG
jgi:hypothetical protein